MCHFSASESRAALISRLSRFPRLSRGSGHLPFCLRLAWLTILPLVPGPMGPDSGIPPLPFTATLFLFPPPGCFTSHSLSQSLEPRQPNQLKHDPAIHTRPYPPHICLLLHLPRLDPSSSGRLIVHHQPSQDRKQRVTGPDCQLDPKSGNCGDTLVIFCIPRHLRRERA